MNMTFVSPTLIEGHRGEIVTPEHRSYDAVRAVFNGSIDRRPALIARSSSPADVQAAVRFARESGVPLTPRAGGHSLAGLSMVDDGLVIDVRGLKHAYVDPERRRVRAGAGLEWGELDAATQAHGLAVTGGRISNTGV